MKTPVYAKWHSIASTPYWVVSWDRFTVQASHIVFPEIVPTIIMGCMKSPQSGIFALGTVSHAYLEFDTTVGEKGQDLVAAVSSLREPRTTMGGVNLVAGFRPELWSKAAPDDAEQGLQGFNQNLIGIDGFVMPATQHAVLWLSGSS